MGDRLQVDEETGLPVLKSKLRNDRCTRLAARSAALPHISVGIYFCEHTLRCTCREDLSVASRYQRAQLNDEVDAKYGFERYSLPTERTGWLINIHPVRPVKPDRQTHFTNTRIMISACTYTHIGKHNAHIIHTHSSTG